MDRSATDLDNCDVYNVYVVLSYQDGGRWIVDRVPLPVDAVRRGRIDPAIVSSMLQHGAPVGRVLGIRQQVPCPTPNEPAPGRFRDQWRAILFALRQLDRLPVFAQKPGPDGSPAGDYRRVRRSEPGEEFAFGDEPTRVRVVAKKHGDLDLDLTAAARVRVDLWAHSPVEIDPDDPAHTPRRDRDDRVYFEFETDFPDEVCRVINQYGHIDDVEVFRVRSNGLEPLCTEPAPRGAASGASAAQATLPGHNEAATQRPSGV